MPLTTETEPVDSPPNASGAAVAETSDSEHAFSSDVQAPAPGPDVQTDRDPQPAAMVAATPAPPTPGRLVSLDAYRGLVMVLMVSAGLRMGDTAKAFQRAGEWRLFSKSTWERLAYQTDHSQWVGCSLWDLIQPSFMFMVGAALAFSIASRRAKGHSFARMLIHAVVRSIVLVLLAVFLSTSSGDG